MEAFSRQAKVNLLAAGKLARDLLKKVNQNFYKGATPLCALSRSPKKQAEQGAPEQAGDGDLGDRQSSSVRSNAALRRLLPARLEADHQSTLLRIITAERGGASNGNICIDIAVADHLFQ